MPDSADRATYRRWTSAGHTRRAHSMSAQQICMMLARQGAQEVGMHNCSSLNRMGVSRTEGRAHVGASKAGVQVSTGWPRSASGGTDSGPVDRAGQIRMASMEAPPGRRMSAVIFNGGTSSILVGEVDDNEIGSGWLEGKAELRHGIARSTDRRGRWRLPATRAAQLEAAGPSWLTVRARMPRVARRAPSDSTGKIPASL